MIYKDFKINSNYTPKGDQQQGIEELVSKINNNQKYQTLLGVTGSGKTFTIANVIAKVNKPTLIISHNKTLAAQLFSEFKNFFPENKVEFFVSYYDYYLPESYKPSTDTYIAKDASINKQIEKYRLSATSSLLERRDVIVISSVSCIYGLGIPEEIIKKKITLHLGQNITRRDLLNKLVDIHYKRNEIVNINGEFSVKGDVVNIFLAYKDVYAKIEFFGDEIEKISMRDMLNHSIVESLKTLVIYPATHFLTNKDDFEVISQEINQEMRQQISMFEKQNRLVEAQRINQRTNYDLEMIREIGYCSGIENYSRYFMKKSAGERPYTLIDFFPEDYLLVVDESHITIGQFLAMYKADQSRKKTLIENGFRLPSALDNRPMKFQEFEQAMGQTIFVSATPAQYELEKCSNKVTELINRPTGLLDPKIYQLPLEGQIDDLINQIHQQNSKNEKTLVACLTKKNAEDLNFYLTDLGIRCQYLHSEIDVVERIEIISKLQKEEIDCLIGINLLREGIDLPQISLVAILDADKEGFLRSTTSLIQIAGRCARNSNGKVIIYADKKTKSIQEFIKISEYRRSIQLEFNKKNNITPKTVVRPQQISLKIDDKKPQKPINKSKNMDKDSQIKELTKQMLLYARELEFENAAIIRNQIEKLKKNLN